jgi:hypothetical protein
MPEKSLYPTVQELAALPENEFLELCRDSARSDSAHAFKQVGLSALNAATQGTLATIFAVSGLPYAAIGTVILATNELDGTQLSPQELLASYKGQSHAERGFRFLKDPQFFASSLYLKKPERIMALLMVMTVCLLVYAALEYRIRQALKAHQARFPDQKGKPGQNPTTRWVFHYFVGIHLLSVSGQWPLVLNLTEEHYNLLQLLGRPYMQLYGVKYS